MAGLLTLNESCDAIFTSKVCHRFAFEKQGDDTTTDTGSLSNTVKTLENIRKEINETQATWQEEIKEMINNISKGKAQEENLRKYEKDKQNEKNTNVKEIIEETKNEFKNQTKQNNDEWNKRLETHRSRDNEWDRIIKDLNDYTKEVIRKYDDNNKIITRRYQGNKQYQSTNKCSKKKSGYNKRRRI